jgi:hypothetical protein
MSPILTAEELRFELHVIERIDDFIVVRLDLSYMDEVGSATVLGFRLQPCGLGELRDRRRILRRSAGNCVRSEAR